MSDLKSLIAPPVRNLAPYVPGKPLSELEREYGITDSIKLASNENPLGPGSAALAAIKRASEELRLYPDGNGFDLRQAIAKHHGCAMECVTLGNGSNDLLVLMAEAFLGPDTEAVFSQYCFAIYPLVVQATGARGIAASAFSPDHEMAFGHDPAAMARCVTDKTRIVFVANPNNPTGSWITEQPLRALLRSLPPTTLALVDEAYFEYVAVPDYPDTSGWLSEFPNLVVTRTFSKAHALAGLRIGYALSHPDVADALNRVRQPFNVNSLGLVAAQASLGDRAHIAHSVESNRSGMLQITQALARLPVRVFPSAGNFLLVDCRKPAAQVYEGLLRLGVIVRPLTGYGLATHQRITIGTAQQNERLIDALGAVLR